MPVTTLSLFGTNAPSSALATAGLLVSGTGAAGNGQSTTKCGQSTGFSEIFAQGTAVAWQGGANLAAVPVSGNGWLFDAGATTLAGQQLLAGTHTPKLRSKMSVGTATADMFVRVFKLSGDLITFTLIGDCSLASQGLTAALQIFTFSGTTLNAMNFLSGDRLYYHVVYNITANNSGSNVATVAFAFANSATLGRANNAEFDTPGFQPSPVSGASASCRRNGRVRGSEQPQ